jgi:hypothetical protein
MVDPPELWVQDWRDILFYSDNGGQSFYSYNFPLLSSWYPEVGSNGKTVCALIDTPDGSTMKTKIWRSTDGGQSFNPVYSFNEILARGYLRTYNIQHANVVTQRFLYLPADIFSSFTIGNSSATWEVNAYQGKYVYLRKGTGAGQIRRIASNTATTLTIENVWATEPDGTTEFEIISQLSSFVATGVFNTSGTAMAMNGEQTAIAVSVDDGVTWNFYPTGVSVASGANYWQDSADIGSDGSIYYSYADDGESVSRIITLDDLISGNGVWRQVSSGGGATAYDLPDARLAP